jgi:hypothetical protein
MNHLFWFKKPGKSKKIKMFIDFDSYYVNGRGTVITKLHGTGEYAFQWLFQTAGRHIMA